MVICSVLSGYINLWKDTYKELDNNRNIVSNSVCIGNEWYSFPSHFFLPENGRLEYIDDGFKGILPQHYSSINGTWGKPIQPFNDRNKEEVSRYIELSKCNYLVITIDELKEYDQMNDNRRYLLSQHLKKVNNHYKLKFDNISMNGDSMFTIISSRNVLSSEFSHSSLARAYLIPFGFSEKRVKFKSYILLKKI